MMRNKPARYASGVSAIAFALALGCLGAPALAQEAVDGTASGFVSAQSVLQLNLDGFVDQTNVAAGQTIPSNEITISDLGGATTNLSVTGDGSPALVIDGGAPVTSGAVTGGETLQVQITTAEGDYGSTYLATVNADNGASGTFEVITTASAPVDGYLIAGNQSGVLYKIDPNTMTITGTLNLGGARISSIVKGDGTTIFAADSNMVIYKVDALTMTLMGTHTSGQTGISYSYPQITYADGFVYYPGKLAKAFKLNASTMTVAASLNAYNFGAGVYYDFFSTEIGPDGNLYVGTYYGVQKVNPSTMANLGFFSIPNISIIDIAFGDGGEVYFAGNTTNAATSGVYKYDASLTTELAAYTALPKNYPYTVELAEDGTVFSKSNTAIYHLDANLNLITQGTTDFQYALALDSNGTLYDARWSRVYKMDPATLTDGAYTALGQGSSMLYMDSFQPKTAATLYNGVSYSKTSVAPVSLGVGGSGDYTLSVSGDTIPGITVVDGYFNGTPTTNGTYALTYTVTDTDSGKSYSGTATVTVANAPTPTLMTLRETGQVLAFWGTSYRPINLRVPVAEAGSDVTYTVSGALPTGISFDPETATFSGTSSGYSSNILYTFPVTVRATNAYGVYVDRSLTFRICRKVGTSTVCSTSSTFEASDPNLGFEYEVNSTTTTASHSGASIGTVSVVSQLSGCTDSLGGTTTPNFTISSTGTFAITYNSAKPLTRYTCRYVFQNASGARQQTTFRVWNR